MSTNDTHESSERIPFGVIVFGYIALAFVLSVGIAICISSP